MAVCNLSTCNIAILYYNVTALYYHNVNNRFTSLYGHRWDFHLWERLFVGGSNLTPQGGGAPIGKRQGAARIMEDELRSVFLP